MNPIEIVRNVIFGARVRRRGKEAPQLEPVEVTPDGRLKIDAETTNADLVSSGTLAQLVPSATTLTDIFTATKKSEATFVMVCNQNAGAITFRIALAIGGAANNAKQYWYYDMSVPGKGSYIAAMGIGMNATDVLRVYSDTANVSFNVNGINQ
jgi:hypothetical protein